MLMKRTRINFIARLWFYFRQGYATYLTFILGALNTLVVVWYLAIKDVPLIENLFGHFESFAVVTTLVGVPLAIGLGWLHYKRTPAYSSEMDIGVEANPYYYKYAPGYIKDVWGPLYLELLTTLRRLLETNKLLSNEEKTRLDELERKLKLLNEGGFVGQPRNKM